MADAIFWTMLALLITHELDAMYRHEWRVLPLTSALPEDRARTVFLWAHLPLLSGILIGLAGPATGWIKTVLSGFSIVHVLLHWRFRHHPMNEFNNAGSWTLIFLCGLAGATHLLMKGAA